MPRNDRNKPVPTRSKRLVPVVLLQNFRGCSAGDTYGYKPQLAADLVNSRKARWYDDDARQMAERHGFAEKAKLANSVDAEVAARAEEVAARIVADRMAEMEEKMATVVAANKKGSAVVSKFEEDLAAKDAEIAALKEAAAKSGSK